MRTQEHHPVLIAIVAVIVAAAIALFVYAEQHIPQDTKAQEEASLKAAVQQSAIQCFAVEGAYPSTLAHLENKYNLVVNHKDYIVTYSCFASNIMPEIEVFTIEED